MTHQFDAIYDGGVLKPLVPLPLPDKARVKITVSADPLEPPADVLARQQAALDELRTAASKLPQTRNNDGWCVRRHDELLYGPKR